MSEKKKPGRFTLQFNMEDPQQRMVSPSTVTLAEQ